MKSISIIVALLLCVSCLQVTAQKTETITDSSKTKAALFSSSLLWVQKTWGDPDKVIGTRDLATGIIQVKGGLKAVAKSDGGFQVKGMTLTELTITITEGTAKLDFQHINFKWDAGTVWDFSDDDGGTQKEKWKTDVTNEINEMIASYKAAL